MSGIDQAAWATRIRAQMDFEWQREGPPEGFPVLPPIPTGRYTDPAFYADDPLPLLATLAAPLAAPAVRRPG